MIQTNVSDGPPGGFEVGITIAVLRIVLPHPLGICLAQENDHVPPAALIQFKFFLDHHRPLCALA